MEDTVIVIFQNRSMNQKFDIEIPLYITANELVIALNKGFSLGILVEDWRNCYLKSENPIALLRGNKTLAEYGIRNGSILIYDAN